MDFFRLDSNSILNINTILFIKKLSNKEYKYILAKDVFVLVSTEDHNSILNIIKTKHTLHGKKED